MGRRCHGPLDHGTGGKAELAGDYGAHPWHSHEMLFGFASAVLAGFLLTAVPNWTGRLPVSGRPLMLLFGLWCAGRAAMLSPALLGSETAAAADFLFLPTLLLDLRARGRRRGRKWADLKVIAGLGVLRARTPFSTGRPFRPARPISSPRFGIAAYVGLIIVVGGRILPSFTRTGSRNKAGQISPSPMPSTMSAILASAHARTGA